jgi:signal peptidase I
MTPRGQKSMSDGGMKLEPPDRAIVNKLMRPRRWDVVAFRSVAPSDVGALRWSRLVGLPGETVFVEDGGVWVNDQKMTLPTELAGLKYGMRRMDLTRLMGTRERPWRLGPDECCLLGDFSEISFDSRFYGAVPMRNVQGVVTLRYWPMSRVHVFR